MKNPVIRYESEGHLPIGPGVSPKQVEMYSEMVRERLIVESNPEVRLIGRELGYQVYSSLNSLTPREAKVIEMYFGLRDNQPMTLEEIGATFNLTELRVGAIKEKAVRRLRHASRARALRQFLC